MFFLLASPKAFQTITATPQHYKLGMVWKKIQRDLLDAGLFNVAAQMLIYAKEHNGMYFQIISPRHFNLSQYFPVKEGGYH